MLIYFEVILAPDTIKNGTYIKIRPHNKELIEKDFLEDILENYLSNFSCLNKNTTIPIKIFDKFYDIDIIDTKPDKNIYIVNSDINIDFDKPVNYVNTNLLNNVKGANINNISNYDSDIESNHNDSDSDEYVWGQDINKKEKTKKSKSFNGTGYKLN